MNLWLNQMSQDIPRNMKGPDDTARYELAKAGIEADLHEDPSMGDAYRIDPLSGGSFRGARGRTQVWSTSRGRCSGGHAGTRQACRFRRI